MTILTVTARHRNFVKSCLAPNPVCRTSPRLRAPGYKMPRFSIFNMAAFTGSSGEDMASGQDAQSALLELDKGFSR